MYESILNSIKLQLGISPDVESTFDIELMTAINSTFLDLNQLGFGSNTDIFQVTSPDTKWTDYLEDIAMYPSIKTYIFLKVKCLFDPPGTSFLIEAIQKQLAEIEWRLTVQKENNDLPVPVPPVEE